jgi:hypothetical protein
VRLASRRAQAVSMRSLASLKTRFWIISSDSRSRAKPSLSAS